MPLPGHLSSLYPDVTTVLIFFTVDQFCHQNSHTECVLFVWHFFLFDIMIFRFVSIIVCISNLFLFSSEWYFFLGVVGGLCCRTWVVGGEGAVHCRARALSAWAAVVEHTGSVVVVHDLVALQPVGSSQTRDQTHVPCIARQVFILCATREVPEQFSIV